MEIISISSNVIANFIFNFVSTIILLLGIICCWMLILINELFFLFSGFYSWLSHLVDNEALKSWLQILANPIAILIATGFVNYKLAKDKEDRESKLAEEKETKEKEKEEENKRLAEEEKNRQLEDKRQAILTDYLKQMTTLLIDKELATKPHDNPTARVARALTLATIRELDSGRNQLLINFLHEANLIQGGESENDNLPCLLKGANLESANLEGANLESANLESVNLKSACLIGANLESACLKGVNLGSANLESACLKGVNLKNMNFWAANLQYADLRYADLKFASFLNANLKEANLRNTNIGYSIFFLEDLVDLYDFYKAYPHEYYDCFSDADENFLWSLEVSQEYIFKDEFGNNEYIDTDSECEYEYIVPWKDANVKNAKFVNNKAIGEQRKADLINRGAIFED